MESSIQYQTVENYLSYTPSDLDTMSMEEKVDFLMRERLLMSNIITYIIGHIQEIDKTTNTNILEFLPERLRIAGYYKQQYKYPDIQKRYTDAHEKAIKDEYAIRESMRVAKEDFYQHVVSLLDNLQSNTKPCS